MPGIVGWQEIKRCPDTDSADSESDSADSESELADSESQPGSTCRALARSPVRPACAGSSEAFSGGDARARALRTRTTNARAHARAGAIHRCFGMTEAAARRACPPRLGPAISATSTSTNASETGAAICWVDSPPPRDRAQPSERPRPRQTNVSETGAAIRFRRRLSRSRLR